MESVQVYDYSDPKEYLSAVLAKKKEINPHFSLRAWAKHLGLANHSLLSMVLNGNRRLKSKMAVKIATALKLPEKDAKYFDLLVLYTNASSNDERDLYSSMLAQLHPAQKFHELKSDTFKVVNDWRHFLIPLLFGLQGFKPSLTWISNRIGKRMTPDQVNDAIQRLLRVGLLRQDEEGKISYDGNIRFSQDDVPNETVRKCQAQILDEAKKALEKQSPLEREFQFFTFTMEKSRVQEAKKAIRDFKEHFAAKFAKDAGDEVFELGIQFFRLTEPDYTAGTSVVIENKAEGTLDGGV